jgi:hypothetical protein
MTSWLEPDMTGARLAAIRSARRGAVLAAVVYGVVVAAAALTIPASTSATEPVAALVVLLSAIPGIALLGAGLTSAAVESRPMAAIAGLAAGVGVPVAAIVPALIATWLVNALVAGTDAAGPAAGLVLRTGVGAAIRVAPIVALASLAWVVLVRRYARPRAVDPT